MIPSPQTPWRAKVMRWPSFEESMRGTSFEGLHASSAASSGDILVVISWKEEIDTYPN